MWDLARGRFWPPSYYPTVTFWMAFMAVSFQLSHWLGVSPIWRTFSFAMLITAPAVAAFGNQLGYPTRARVLYGMAEHLGAALAITDLEKIDPATAERMADECRQLTVAAMAVRNG